METKDYFMQIQEDLLLTAEKCREGELSNLDTLIKMRQAKEEAERILETVKNFEDERINEIANEADNYKGSYCGYEIKMINGRQMFNFKSIPQFNELEQKKKEVEDKFKSAFLGFQKGTVQTTEVYGILYWIDDAGELQLFPELTMGKSYLSVKQNKK